jgi:hypothetical protein
VWPARRSPFEPETSITSVIAATTQTYDWHSSLNSTLNSQPIAGYQISDDDVTWYDATSAVQTSAKQITYAYATYLGLGATVWRCVAPATGVDYAAGTPPIGQSGLTG